MPLTTTNVVLSYTNVAAGVPIVAAIPAYATSEIYVKYGSSLQYAVVEVDYTVTLNYTTPTPPPSTTYYTSVTITPTASLMTKITADGVNIIYVGRYLPLTTSFAQVDAFTRAKLDAEFARTNMKLQQLEYGSTLDAEDSARQAAASAADAAASAALSAAGAAPLSVIDFGAVGNGVTDDSIAIGAAIEYASVHQTELYVPAGDYLLNNRVINDKVGAAIEQYLTIRGAGSGITRFIVNNPDGGIRIYASNRQLRVKMSGLRFEARGFGRGIALEIIHPTGGASHHYAVYLDDIVAVPEDATKDYFTVGISVAGALRPYMNMLKISGIYIGVTSYADTAPVFYMDTGLDVSGCYGAELHNSSIWSCKTAFKWYTTTGQPEGWNIKDCGFANVQVGCDIATPGTEPGGYLMGSHINSTHRGVWIRGSKLIIIGGNSFYNVDVANESLVSPVDIHIDGDTDQLININNNLFEYGGHTGRKNIVVESNLVAGHPIMVTGNMFSAPTVQPSNIFDHPGGSEVFWSNNVGLSGMVYPTALQNHFAPPIGTAIRDGSVLNSDTITATDANIRLLTQWVKSLGLALNEQGVTSPFVSTNMTPNPRGKGATVGTPGVAPTYWTYYGLGGLTTTLVGFGADPSSNIDYVDMRWFGSAAGACGVRFNNGWLVAALDGQFWTEEVWISLVAGSLTNVTSITIDMSSASGGGFGTPIAGHAGPDIKGSITSLMKRFSYGVTLTGGPTVSRVISNLNIVHSGALPVDFTLRIGWPQLYR